MDRGRGWTELVIRKMEIPAFCPLRHFHLLRGGAASRGCSSAVFCSEKGIPYAASAPLSTLLKRVLTAAGIDPRYPAYSIRHALITALFDSGLSEPQVNAYTGHSNNAHTAATNYFHLNRKWVGNAIAKRVLSERAKDLAETMMRVDNEEKLREEMEEYGESEADVLGSRE